jgi:hypothetical protein
MFLTEKNILMSKVISHVHYIYIASPVLKKKIGYKLFYNTSLFQFNTILSNSGQSLAMQLSLHLICFIIRLYSCNINPHHVNLWFLFCILLMNITVLWSVNTINGWHVHHNCFKYNNKGRHLFSKFKEKIAIRQICVISTFLEQNCSNTYITSLHC